MCFAGRPNGTRWCTSAGHADEPTGSAAANDARSTTTAVSTTATTWTTATETKVWIDYPSFMSSMSGPERPGFVTKSSGLCI